MIIVLHKSTFTIPYHTIPSLQKRGIGESFYKRVVDDPPANQDHKSQHFVASICSRLVVVVECFQVLNVIDVDYSRRRQTQYHAVRVLDCDAVSQVKQKILDAICRNVPHSRRPAVHDLDLRIIITTTTTTHV